MQVTRQKLSIREKVGYALGDAAANIAWRGVATFLFVFYTDVFGLNPAAVGLLMLIARSSDGVSDVVMGIIGDRTNSKYGKFRPWILWTAIPLAVMLSLLFTTPDLSPTGKIIYAYVTYILFTLIYTANNIPYGALMAVMTGDDKERTSIGSYRMVGAFAGGMLVQGALLFLVANFGDINPTIEMVDLGNEKYEVTVSAPESVENVRIKTKAGVATFVWADAEMADSVNVPTQEKSFSMEAGLPYTFIVEGEPDLDESKITIIDQKEGYSKAIYLMSVLLAISLIITFYTTRERVSPPKTQETNLVKDLKDLISNRPWLVLLIIGLLFNIYNSIKQGITVIYFTHYLHNQLLAGSYMVGLMIASILGAMATSPLARQFGKRRLFIYALIFSGGVNALIAFCGPGDIVPIFAIGIVSEFGAAIFPTLFFAMLGDAADYSEYKNGRRATGLIYSAGSFSTKFGGGLAGAIIGFVLSAFNYDGQDAVAIQGAVPGIVMLMSWIPTVIALLGAVLMKFYPLDQDKVDAITTELNQRRLKEGYSIDY
ncbi:MAG: transporter [Anaerophaga sp.]|uniref:MFS transporter n=1 Tax=Anaerophaga thermohalophila TaxID=177400 RepID=UPI000237CC84|nr:MFS transporter [Anaerophaga thermohalophila]MBZ4676151.1 transporter [Anaerophaga sp.]MDI3520817.1 glycoside/pentoside/hexuronide:cation symporter, family [Anaerophaga sp.]MDK2840943.1 glycoside/pentoside/hexuronide:cation symporter, family [Anaerophaga sp.]MDN5290273.1 glycoside/pentoside/hexuronide:cation symporter, family [Anaerophaga sp.]